MIPAGLAPLAWLHGASAALTWMEYEFGQSWPGRLPRQGVARPSIPSRPAAAKEGGRHRPSDADVAADRAAGPRASSRVACPIPNGSAAGWPRPWSQSTWHQQPASQAPGRRQQSWPPTRVPVHAAMPVVVTAVAPSTISTQLPGIRPGCFFAPRPLRRLPATAWRTAMRTITPTASKQAQAATRASAPASPASSAESTWRTARPFSRKTARKAHMPTNAMVRSRGSRLVGADFRARARTLRGRFFSVGATGRRPSF